MNKLTVFKLCTIKQIRRGNLSIDCKLGLWANVSGKCETTVERKAYVKFKQALLAGDYDLLIKKPVEINLPANTTQTHNTVTSGKGSIT